MLKSTLIPTALALAITALLLVGCEGRSSTSENAVPAASRVENPCAVFDEGIAEGLGNGPYLPGQSSVSGASTTCYRPAHAQAPNLHGATARFERMSRQDFLAKACAAPTDPETGRPLYTVELLSGYHAAACRFMPFGEGRVGLSVLTESGWAVMVGSAPESHCRAAVEKIVSNLPG
jgi:hypothetical protein